jgi:hypothetical protein
MLMDVLNDVSRHLIEETPERFLFHYTDQSRWLAEVLEKCIRYLQTFESRKQFPIPEPPESTVSETPAQPQDSQTPTQFHGPLLTQDQTWAFFPERGPASTRESETQFFNRLLVMHEVIAQWWEQESGGQTRNASLCFRPLSDIEGSSFRSDAVGVRQDILDQLRQRHPLYTRYLLWNSGSVSAAAVTNAWEFKLNNSSQDVIDVSVILASLGNTYSQTSRIARNSLELPPTT